ncbi:MAG TPA: polysaccharide biosynthesis/export family protein [Acidobacteriota bacterium]|jgi:polysaccharide export outer membrane protein|nr:polysaccharide biosynthesis/export family protein [Acidobacteriota bacterium]
MFRWYLPFLLTACFWNVFSQDLNDRVQQLTTIDKQQIEQDYRIGPGDVLEILVFGEEGLSRTVRVAADGTVTLPFLDSLKVAGMTALEVESLVKQGLSRDVIRDPQVSVFIKEYRSQSVFVLGAVQRPGEYQLVGSLHLIDALAMAGGLDLETAGEKAVVQRTFIENGVERSDVVQVNLKTLLDAGDASLNLRLHPGDVVQVSEKVLQLYYVVGEVNRPGAFQLPGDQALLLTQAVAWAGGTMKTAESEKGLLVRYDENGQRQEIAVNFEDIIKGRRPDFTVQANDVIFIPGSKFKTLGYGLLGVIPQAAQNAAVYGPLR